MGAPLSRGDEAARRGVGSDGVVPSQRLHELHGMVPTEILLRSGMIISVGLPRSGWGSCGVGRWWTNSSQILPVHILRVKVDEVATWRQ